MQKVISSRQISMAKPVIREEESAQVEAVLRSGIISEGDRVAAFEKAFADFVGTAYAAAVNSGTAALYLALLAHGIGPGDEVITTPFTFIATSNAILLAGARPVFVDIAPGTFNIDPDQVAEKITPKTRAIIPVHLYGQPCNLKALMALASQHNLTVIEDACQAHGARYAGKMVGSFGTGCFSFYPTKNMTTGEGGMITTNDSAIAEKVKSIRNHGQKRRYYHDTLGGNYRMTNISGALGLCQLEKLPRLNGLRARNAGLLAAGLEGIEGLVLPVISPGCEHVFHQYTIRLTPKCRVSRDIFRENLLSRGISTEIYYPTPIHLQPLYRELGYDVHLPAAEKAAGEVVSLPVHPSLSEDDVRYTVECIREVISGGN